MNIEEINKLTLDRLFNLQMLELKNLEHYYIRNDLYNKNDIFNVIENLVVINNVMKNKIKKYEKTKK